MVFCYLVVFFSYDLIKSIFLLVPNLGTAKTGCAFELDSREEKGVPYKFFGASLTDRIVHNLIIAQFNLF